MKYLAKNKDSEIISSGLTYKINKDNSKLRESLLKEQKGFCAYTEKYIRETDSYAVEHFDPRLKGEDKDNYFNWYAVTTWLNEHRPKKIEKHLPILEPYSEELSKRIKYEDGIFMTIEPDDTEAKNLINFLCLNKHELYRERQNHIKLIMGLKEDYDSNEKFEQKLKRHKFYLSFITALEYELKMDLTHLLEE